MPFNGGSTLPQSGRTQDLPETSPDALQHHAMGVAEFVKGNFATAVGQNRFAEARTALRALDPDREPMRGWYVYHSVYSSAAHGLGDYEDELRNARKARTAFPGDMRAAALEAQALIALGRTADAEKIMNEIQTMPSTAVAGTAGNHLLGLAQELYAHGNPAAGRRWVQAVIKWHEALSPDSARSQANRGLRASALYLLGDFRAAGLVVDSLVTRHPDDMTYKAWAGYLAAWNGDRRRATEAVQQIESGTIRLTPVNSLLWRGVIAIAMKDRDKGVGLIRQSGMRPGWAHNDPILARELADLAVWREYVKPVT